MGAPARQRFTLKKRELFLDALRECGHVGQAAASVGVSRQLVYAHRKADPEFKLAWEAAADEAAVTVLEAEAVRRATQGVDEPIVYKGEVTGTVRKYSDTLLIFLLKGAMREKYQDSIKHLGDKDQPLYYTDVSAREARIAELRAKLLAGVEALPVTGTANGATHADE